MSSTLIQLSFWKETWFSLLMRQIPKDLVNVPHNDINLQTHKSLCLGLNPLELTLHFSTKNDA